MGLLGDVNFCINSANVWQIVGYAFFIFKIIIPILLIVWGMLDLGRAVVAAKDDEIKKATKSLAMRAIAAVAIFFVPTIVGIVLGLISSFNTEDVREDWNVCRTCITSPGESECENAASSAWNGDIDMN